MERQRLEAAEGRARSKSLGRSETPTKRRPRGRLSSVTFAANAAPASPTPTRTQPVRRAKPIVIPDDSDDESDAESTPVMDEEQDTNFVDEEEGGVTVPPSPRVLRSTPRTTSGSAFAGMTPAKVRMITEALSEAELQEFLTPSRPVRRSLVNQLRGDDTAASPTTRREEIRELNDGFLAQHEQRLSQRKRKASGGERLARDGLPPTPSSGLRRSEAGEPSTPPNDP